MSAAAAAGGGGGGGGGAAPPPAEGRADPAWAPPAEETARMDTIWAGMQGDCTITLPSGRAHVYAGLAAHGRAPQNVLLVIAKSSNANAIVYEYVPPRDAAALPTVAAYWLSLEPSNAEEHLARGNVSLLTALSFEESIVYGANLRVARDKIGATHYMVSLTTPQLKGREFELFFNADDGAPFLVGAIDGKRATPTYAYVQLERGLRGAAASTLKALQEIRLYGTEMDGDGKPVMEKLRAV